jgi:hypothetical protein
MFIQQLGSLIKDAFGHRMLTWEGSIGPRLAGMSIVSFLVNRDGLLSGGDSGGAVCRMSPEDSRAHYGVGG